MQNFPFNLDQLRILKIIVSEGSFKRAAKTLYVSQPAISLQIRKVESKLGLPLFERDKRQIRLTKAGKLLVQYGNRILNLCDESFRAVEDLHQLKRGTLIIGASKSTGTYLLPKLIGLFRHRYPKINVKLKVNSSHRISWGVANGQIDIAIMGGHIPNELENNLKVTPYVEDELALIFPKSHPFSNRYQIKKEDLYDLNFITLETDSMLRKLMEDLLNQHGIDNSRLKIGMELNSVEAIKNAVQSGLGVAFVSVSTIIKELELKVIDKITIENILIKKTLSIVTNRNRCKSIPSKNFEDEILNFFGTLPHYYNY
uniref:Probable RuBisCO transcriptional regulator n=1 Tax=Schizocladia ischiensis TaxID=196139 RepID=A0A7U3S1F0_9STRA|nr:rbcR [Schizocladia ischiensis]QOW07494.1 rbcR [Schizocladia ischiensis]